VDGSTLVLVCSAFQVAVYVMGLAAALRLLEKRSGAWWAALVSLVFISALLLLSGKWRRWSWLDWCWLTLPAARVVTAPSDKRSFRRTLWVWRAAGWRAIRPARGTGGW
jgi:hypothetical protein